MYKNLTLCFINKKKFHAIQIPEFTYFFILKISKSCRGAQLPIYFIHQVPKHQGFANQGAAPHRRIIIVL